MNSESSQKTPGHLSLALRALLDPRYLVAPLAIVGAVFLAPRLRVSDAIADLIHFASASATAIVSLVIAAKRRSPSGSRLALAVISLVTWVVIALRGKYDAAAVVAGSSALVLFAHAIGDWVGEHIEDVGHLFPACVVAGAVDIASVVHPRGPTHAIVSSARALALSAISFPVPGTSDYAPAVGIGDLLFMAILFGASRKHDLSLVRMGLLAAAGIAIAGFASALLGAPVPALPSIGLCVVLGYGRVRVLKRKDRGVAVVFMVGAIAVALGTVGTRFLGN